ncbi:odorant receptor 43a-like [Pseudomyrmex gracilis]|uniref:odorant receptor 43a-like n=1 Tax=Pseudomyrmex gracilis TaxID=219809 RepID=UPI000995067C|nr:odorant receptor 43a-like [Pseudomyrmex gracilis]
MWRVGCKCLHNNDMDISERSSYRDFVWAIELNRFGLEFVGLWPAIDKTSKTSSVSDLRVVISFVTVTLLTVIPLIYSLVRVWGDMILIIDNLQLTLPMVMISFKIVIMRWKRSAVTFIVKMIAEDWMTVRTEAERNVMIRQARVARVIMICGYSLMGFAFVMLIILPSFGIHFRYLTNITDGVRELPLQTSYFYKTDKSPQFELTLASQAVAIFVGGIAYTSVDAFFGLAIIHICGQLENFQHRMITLVSNINFDAALRNNILSGAEISDMSITRKFFVLLCIVILFSHMLLYCAAGEMVAKQCEEVYRTICNLEWYKLESRKRRNFVILMLRCNKPFHITAGKLFPLTMSTFCSLVKTSAGYISFLLAKSE